MEFLVASPKARLDVIRDLKDAGYGAAAPNEDDQGETGYTLVVDDIPRGEEQHVEAIVLAIDPFAQRDRAPQ